MLNRKIIFVSIANEQYFSMLVTMVKSVSLNFPHAHFYLELINMGETEKAYLENINSNVQCSLIRENFTHPYQEKCYCANRKSLAIYNAYSSNKDSTHIIWMDADNIFRKDAHEYNFYNEVISGNYCIMIRKLNNKYLSGFFVLNLSRKEAVKLIHDYKAGTDMNLWKTLKNGGFRKKNGKVDNNIWMTDQNVLNALLKRNKCDIKELDTKIMDASKTQFEDFSMIWAAIWDYKFKDQFMNESRIFNDQFDILRDNYRYREEKYNL